jgi:hypothetical protein
MTTAQADVSEHHAASPPQVRLGALLEGGLAPAILAIVERGAYHRPALARSLRAEIELQMDEYKFPPVRIVFGEHAILVEDGGAVSPDLRVSGALADMVHLMVIPLVAGIPNPINTRGRAGLRMVAGGRVRIEGRLGLMRRFLTLIRA